MTEPCGTPHCSSVGSDLVSSMRTCCCLPLRYDANHFATVPERSSAFVTEIEEVDGRRCWKRMSDPKESRLLHPQYQEIGASHSELSLRLSQRYGLFCMRTVLKGGVNLWWCKQWTESMLHVLSTSQGKASWRWDGSFSGLVLRCFLFSLPRTTHHKAHVWPTCLVRGCFLFSLHRTTH